MKVVTSSDSVLYDPSIDYKTKQIFASKPTLSQVQARQFQTTEITTTYDYYLELPSMVPIKMCDSILEIESKLEQKAPDQNFAVPLDYPPIETIEAQDSSGIYLQQPINKTNQYIKTIAKAETPLKDFLTYHYGDDGTATTIVGDIVPLRHNTQYGTDGKISTGNANATESAPRYFSVLGGNTGLASVNVSYRIPLGIIKNSFFSCDKFIVFPKPVTIKVTVPAPPDWGFGTAPAVAPTAEYKAPLTKVTVTNIRIQVCQESSLALTKQLVDRMNTSGFVIACRNVYQNNANITSQTHTPSIRISQGNGSHLLKAYFVPTVQGTGPARFGNVKPANLSYFTPRMNNEPLTKQAISVTQGTDWLFVKDMIKGSALSNRTAFERDYFYLQDFAGFSSTGDRLELEDSGSVGGYELLLNASDIILDSEFTFSASTTINWFMYVVTNRYLIINKDGVQSVSNISAAATPANNNTQV